MINKSVDDFIDQYKALTNDQIVSYIILSSKIAENFIIDVKKIKKGAVDALPVPAAFSDIGDPGTLEDILRKIRDDVTGTVDNWILVCWGHAMGYSLFNLITTSDKFFSHFKFNQLLGSTDEWPGLKPIWKDGLAIRIWKEDMHVDLSDSPGRKGVTALTINELSSTLEKVKIPFDLIVLDNCYVQNIDTLYALGDKTRFIIAAQTAIPWQSFLYHTFNSLNAKLDNAFCIEFCNGSEKKLSLLEKQVAEADKIWYQNISFSCLNTSSVAAFRTSIETILTYLYDNYMERTLAQAIVNALFKGYDLTQTGFAKDQSLSMIDLNRFLMELKAQLNPGVHPRLVTLLGAHEPIHAQLLLVNKPTSLLANKSTGLSICFPLRFELLDKHPYYGFFLKDNARIKTGFAKKTNWGVFLHDFLWRIS